MCIYDIYGPCSYPHGRCFTIMAQLFSIGSFITSTMALTSCLYVYVQPIPIEGQVELPKEGFGFLSRQIKIKEPPSYGKSCVFYTANERSMYFDSMWNTGYTMAMFSVIIGIFIMVITLSTCCIAYKEKTFDIMYWFCIICFICQMLTFMAWGSELCTGEIEYECTWSSGTGMNITAAMMWIWAANMIKSFPEALSPPKRRPRNRNRNRGDGNDDDSADGDVMLNNVYRDDDNDDGYDDEGDGYYDEDGNWVEGGNSGPMEDDEYDEDGYYDDDGNWVANEDNQYGDGEYEGYDGYDDVDGGNDYNDEGGGEEGGGGKDGGYYDYENEDGDNWAAEDREEEEENSSSSSSSRKIT